ncbi:hypothetical protein H4S06_002158, partial [Coemansia sp. BCRC 34490]
MAPNETQGQQRSQTYGGRRVSTVRGLNVGSTLQSSLAPGSRRRKSTAGGGAAGLWMASEDQRMSIQTQLRQQQ